MVSEDKVKMDQGNSDSFELCWIWIDNFQLTTGHEIYQKLVKLKAIEIPWNQEIAEEIAEVRMVHFFNLFKLAKQCDIPQISEGAESILESGRLEIKSALLLR